MANFKIDNGNGILRFTGQRPDNAVDALKLSIEKWETVMKACQDGILVHERGRTTCALCTLYYDDFCEECPVALKTGREDCMGTPYYDYHKAILDGRNLSAALSAAKAELKFLKGLK